MSQPIRPSARVPAQSPHDTQPPPLGALQVTPLSPQQPQPHTAAQQRPHSARPLQHGLAPPPPSPMHQFSAARAALAANSISLDSTHGAASAARPIPRSASFSSFDGSSRVLTARELRSYERSDGLTIESGYEEPPEGDAAASAHSGTLAGRKRPVLLSTPRKLDASLVERSPIPLSIHTIPLDAIAVPQWRRAAERQQAQARRDAAIMTVAEEDSSERLRENRSVSDSSAQPTATAAAAPAEQEPEEHAPTLARRASMAVFQSLAVQKLAQESADDMALEDFIDRSKRMLPSHTPAALDLCGPDAEQVLSRWVSDTLEIDAGNLLAVQVVAPASDQHHVPHPLSAPTTSATSSTSANYPHYSGDAVSLLIDASIAPPKLVGVVKVFSFHRAFEKELLALTRMHAWLDPPSSAPAVGAATDAQAQPQQSGVDVSAATAAAIPAPVASAPSPSCPRIIRVPTAIGAHFALTPAGKGGVLVMTPADGLPLDDYFVSLSRAAHAQAADPPPQHAERHELFSHLLDGIKLAATAFFQLHTIPRGSGGKVKKNYSQQYVMQSENIIARIREKLGEPPGGTTAMVDSTAAAGSGGAASASTFAPASSSNTVAVAGTGTLPEAGEIWKRFSSHQHLLDASALSARLRPLVEAALQSRGLSCVVHGDAHLGNVFYDRAAGSITLIDVPFVNASVGDRGEPIGCAARDVANFVHKIHLASLAHGCAPKEALQLQSAFLDTYRARFFESGLPLALSMETFHFFLIRSLLGELHRGLKDHSLGLATIQALEHALIDAELFLHRRQDLVGRNAMPLRLAAPRPSDARVASGAHGSGRSGPGFPVDDGGDDDDVQDDAVALQLHDEELAQEALAEAERLKTEAARQEMREQDALNEAGAPGLGNEADEERDLFDQDDDPDEAPYPMAMGPAAFAQAGSCVSDVNDHAQTQMYAFSPVMPSHRPLRRHDAAALPPLALGPMDAAAKQQLLYPPRSPSSMFRQQSVATPSYPSGVALGHPGYPLAPAFHPSMGPYSSLNGGRILVVLGAPLKADMQTPDVWLESRLKQTVAIFYRMLSSGLNALVLAGGRNPGMEVSAAKVMERWLRPYGIRSNSSRFLLLNEDMSSCGSAESYPRDLVSQAFCLRSMLRVRGFRHGNILVICNDFQLALVASCMNRVFRSGTGLVALEYIGAPTVRAYAPSAGVEAARLKELPLLMRELRPAFQQFFPYGRCGLLDACRAGSMQTLRLILEGQPGAAAATTSAPGSEAASMLVNTERDGLGCSGLHIAAENGFTDLCAYLLQRGADPNARSTLGATPLHYATALGRLDVVELLLEWGAGPSCSLKGGCGRGCWLGSRRPCDMHRNGPSPMLAASTHLVQEAQPQWSTITCLVQPEAMPLAEAEADIRREHDEEIARRRRAAGAMHRSASTNKLSHSRAGSGDTSHLSTPTGRHGSGMDVPASGGGARARIDPPSNPPSAPSSPRHSAGSVEGNGSPVQTSKDDAGASDAQLATVQLHWSSGPLPPPLSLYPSLRSKRVLLLRHSESLWNVNGSHRVRGLIDTTLTNMGVKQARQLRTLLQRTGALQRLGVRLVAVSPLTRTLQTYMLAVRWYLDLFPNAPAIPAATLATTAPGSVSHTPGSSVAPTPAAASAAGHAFVADPSHLAVPAFESASPRPGAAPCPVRVVVRSELAEQLLSTGTIGRAPDQLAKDFGDPSLDFSTLAPVWWYAPERDDAAAGAGGAGGVEGAAAAAAGPTSVAVPAPPANTRIFLKREPIEHLRRRIHRFLYWLDQQPETSVLVVGHGTYFREMVDAAHAYTDVFKANLFIWRM